MNCLCQTMSHCVVDDNCTGAACGPFRINREYWAASGKPVIHYGVPDIDNEYNKCVKNWGCSVRSVLGYLSRFQQDCNGNGKFDCYDYIATHLFGPHECRKKKLTGEYLQRYQSCDCGKIPDCH
ncbi:hypothetical protein Zmor_024186 [Zophobas morio]|uniref:lysozyme n=1 Tax=Zophobas morio TaxID=2755281 RepID=A0AA38I071_9CUCU|nr:hypothetical protein Zmor_024186 [Zophobas morio]